MAQSRQAGRRGFSKADREPAKFAALRHLYVFIEDQHFALLVFWVARLPTIVEPDSMPSIGGKVYDRLHRKPYSLGYGHIWSDALSKSQSLLDLTLS